MKCKHFEKIKIKIAVRLFLRTPELNFMQFGEYSIMRLNLLKKDTLLPIQDGGGLEKLPSPTSTFPVTSINVGITP